MPGRETQAERASWLGEGQLTRSKLTVKAEVNVQVPAGSEVVKQVLTVSFDGAELSSVQQCRTFFEPAVWRFHGNDATAEQLFVLSRVAVKFVSFWHSVVTCWM